MQAGGEIALNLGADRVTERLDYRPFGANRANLTFGSPSDSMLRVLTWSRGFVRAVWHSKRFGRLGTVELVRGRVPPTPQGMRLVPGISGRYSGPSVPGGFAEPGQKTMLELRAVPRAVPGGATLLDIDGIAGSGEAIPHGTYEWQTGAVSLVAERHGLITGVMGLSKLSMLAPSDVGFFRLKERLVLSRER